MNWSQRRFHHIISKEGLTWTSHHHRFSSYSHTHFLQYWTELWREENLPSHSHNLTDYQTLKRMNYVLENDIRVPQYLSSFKESIRPSCHPPSSDSSPQTPLHLTKQAFTNFPTKLLQLPSLTTLQIKWIRLKIGDEAGRKIWLIQNLFILVIFFNVVLFDVDNKGG